MENNFGFRIKKAWNAFLNRDTYQISNTSNGSYYRPDRPRLTRGNERSIITSIINKIALDVALTDILHCNLDESGRYKETRDSSLNTCLSLEANIDQTGRNFIQDVVMTMFDEGCVAIVPVDTAEDPTKKDSFEVLTVRTGKVMEWYPDSVKVDVYNDRNGRREQITMPKRKVAIIENPLYAVMNEPNSTLQRLIRKLTLLDIIDEASGSGKLDLIIQLPYTVKSPTRRDQAEQRRKDIEDQLRGTKYGIAYTDGTEKITQLNRPVENNLMKQIEYLTSMLYSQLGISQAVLDGTADDSVMNNYYARSLEPILNSIVDEINRKFLTKTARSQKQKVLYNRDPFKLIPVSKIAEIADKFTRNEILSSNEIRQIVGRRPSNDPKADELRNSNISQAKTDIPISDPTTTTDLDNENIKLKKEEIQNGV